MCLWCEVEERVYNSYREQERKALETIQEVTREQDRSPSDREESADRLRCIWEKKLEYVTARMLRERLAQEMTDAELCGGEEGTDALPRSFPTPTLPSHLLSAFERYVESLFHRLTRPQLSSPRSRRAGNKLLPFPPPRGPAS